jgi:hypothetical protein
MCEVENAVTTSLEDFDLVVESFHKATVLALGEKLVISSRQVLSSFRKSSKHDKSLLWTFWVHPRILD